jgi:HD-GYP domain-containing protein (c-di-GMP phosphodiesterase class II)
MPTMREMLLAERLVGEARSRRATGMAPRERVVLTISAMAFLAVAVACAVVLPNERDADLLLAVGLVIGYVLIERVRFEFGGGYGTAEQLILVPILLLAPLPWAPLMIALANAVSMLPEILEGRWHRQRVTGRIADLWYCVPPVLVIAALAPGELRLDDWWVYTLALGAQLGGDLAWTLLRARLLDNVPFHELATGWFGSARVDLILAPVAFTVSLVALESPVVLLAIGPLAWLLHSFATDRKERYTKTLELQRAYRGTVMLLSDVVEFEDDYTAQHSRSVVELVNAVADELGVHADERQELEFAALLHDVGKIAIPKEILNKPAALTAGEFEVMKTHTIEGQFMLDRVGGLLGRVGEIVRSCHERWDGAGYPDGLKGDEIPLASRIVFACDAYHAITSERAYRPARSKREGIAELVDNAGGQFDPRVVEALVTVVETREFTGDAVGDEVRAVLASAPVHNPVAPGPGL